MRPTRLTWFLTHRCNIACSYCATILPEQMTADLDAADTERAARALCRFGAEVVILTGGEALMHPHAQLVVDVFNDEGQDFVVLTNATRPVRVTGVRNISCSIDTADVPTRARRLAVNADAEFKSSWGWELLTTARDRGMEPTASIVVGRHNARHVPQLISTLAEHGVASMLGILHEAHPASGVHWRFRARGEGNTLTQPQAERLSVLLCAMKDAGAPILNDRSYLAAIARHGAALDWHCDTPSDLIVDSDGSVLTCQDWWGHRCKTLNVLDVGDDVDGWCERWATAHRADNAECPGCFWNCTFQAATSSSSVRPGARA